MNNLISIKETVKDHYTALEYMCDGLLKQSKRKKFKIDMTTYGSLLKSPTGNKICYGCAATSTIQQIAKTNFKVSDNSIEGVYFRAEALGFDTKELSYFEDAIDQARRGDLGLLKLFFNKEPEYRHSDKGWYLDTNNWKLQIPLIRKYIRDGRKKVKENVTKNKNE